MGELTTQPQYRLSLRQGVQVVFVAALGLGLTGSLAARGLPPSDVLLGALVTVLATGHVYVLLCRENRTRRLMAASAEAVRRARAESERATREKREFMANVGHELGAPLAAIVGFAEVLRTSDDRAPSERHEVVETILRSGRRLLNMTTDMLDLSRLEAGRLTVQRGDCAPVAIIGEVETLMRPLAAQRGLRFRIEQAGPIPMRIHTDPARLRQILVNLATHTLRAAEQGAAVVTISLDQEGGRLLMEAPAGRGARALERLLGHAESPTSGRFDSVRLGLVIAQRLAALLGGGLELAEGSACRRATVRASVETGSLEGVEMAPDQGDGGRVEAPPAPRAALSAVVELDRRILVVDEDGDDRRLIAFNLRHAGAEVEIEPSAAESASRALAALEGGRPFDLLVIDAQEEQLAEVRRLRQAGYEEAIVAVGGAGEACTREACLEAGCSDFVEGPVSRAGLLKVCAGGAGCDGRAEEACASEAA
jgi:two-component system CheB/CheR fusion protein